MENSDGGKGLLQTCAMAIAHLWTIQTRPKTHARACVLVCSRPARWASKARRVRYVKPDTTAVRLLADTHAMYWYIEGDLQRSQKVILLGLGSPGHGIAPCSGVLFFAFKEPQEHEARTA
jgi:hypothetical protein